MRKLIQVAALAGATIVMTATAASASVSFDSATGTGFVGKGDVQLAFGWNNAQLQSNAGSVTFTYNSTDTYTAVCSWMTGEGTRGEQAHNVDHDTSTTVASAVNGDPRKVKGQTQFTGFNLNGFDGVPVESGEDVPAVGGACPGNQGTDGVWSTVTLISSTGGLFVNYGGATVALPNTPVL